MQDRLILRLVMPSVGDMELASQEGGVIELTPVFYGNESMGPHIQIIREGKSGTKEMIGRYRLKIKEDGRLEMKRGQV